MAVRKTGAQGTRNRGRKTPGRAAPRGKPQRVSLAMVFWILFIIVLVTTFFALLPAVRKNNSRQDLPTAERVVPREAERDTPAVTQRPPAASTQSSQQEDTTRPAERPSAEAPTERTTQIAPSTSAESPRERPAEQAATPPPAAQPQAAQPSATQPQAAQPQAAVPSERPVETRERSVYFMQETRGGAELLLVKVGRRVPASDSPLLDSLNALLMGPTTTEQNRGLINFVPPGTRILSALVRGNTAYISFNEEFQYSTYGREGFTAQIQQIVWTATEFPNVHDVQFLIEGRRVDFLGEGIMIGSPIQR